MKYKVQIQKRSELGITEESKGDTLKLVAPQSLQAKDGGDFKKQMYLLVQDYLSQSNASGKKTEEMLKNVS